MKYTQFLIFEICRECNLGAVHTKCPNTDPARFANVDTSRMLDDETIIETAVTMIRVHGFRGCIGWHYYNEPLLKAARILSLMQRIREREPSARFVLWTNGTKIPTDPAALSRLSAFDRAWVTNYDGGDYKRIRTAIPQTTEVRWQLDARRDEQRGGNTAPCGRMFSEFVFDCFGNVHICCIDWRGECTVGNIHADPLPDLVERFQRIRASVAAGIKGNAPQVCKKCQVKHARISDLVPEIAAAARQAVKDESLPYLRRGAETLCVVGMGDVSATWKAHHAARCEKLLR
ncbi:MAG: SPASM domain-containing protein, partial [Candidatus Shapirobacteria bacterium]